MTIVSGGVARVGIEVDHGCHQVPLPLVHQTLETIAIASPSTAPAEGSAARNPLGVSNDRLEVNSIPEIRIQHLTDEGFLSLSLNDDSDLAKAHRAGNALWA